MGGFGSGRNGGVTVTVESCKSLDANRWMRERILARESFRSGLWGWTDSRTGEVRSTISYAIDTTFGRPSIARLTYTFTETAERLNYPIQLQTTYPRYGGMRWWFTCPLTVNGASCGRRVQKLFLPPGGKYFGCRHCYRLTYESRREDAATRALTKTQKIRSRLNGNPSLNYSFPPKPKGMWERTYRGLKTEAEEAENRSWSLLGGWWDDLKAGLRRGRRKPRVRPKKAGSDTPKKGALFS